MLRLSNNKTIEQRLLEKLIITGSINFSENNVYEYRCSGFTLEEDELKYLIEKSKEKLDFNKPNNVNFIKELYKFHY